MEILKKVFNYKKSLVFLIVLFSAYLYCEEIVVPVFYSTDKIEEISWSSDSKSFAYKTNGKVYIRNSDDLILTSIVEEFPNDFEKKMNSKNKIKTKVSSNDILLFLESGEKRFSCPQNITTYDVSNDEKTLILGTNSGKLYFYDIPTNKKLGFTPPYTNIKILIHIK